MNQHYRPIPVLLSLAIAVVMLPGCHRRPHTQTVSATNASAKTTVLHFNVKGMHCSGCEEAIKAKLAKLPGVTACNASHSAGTVDLTTTDPAIASTAAEDIASLGYTVESTQN